MQQVEQNNKLIKINGDAKGLFHNKDTLLK